MSETPSIDDKPGAPGQRDVSRRTAVKVAAAAGVGAVVWAEPTIKGLARRPAYASNGSSAGTPQLIEIMGDVDAAGNITNLSASPTNIDGFSIVLTSQGTPTNDPRLRLQSPPEATGQRLIFNTAFTPTSSTFDFRNPPLTSNGRRVQFDMTTLPPATMGFSIFVEIICLPA